MKKVLIGLFFVTLLFSENLNKLDLITLFKKNYYTYICMNRWKFINKYNRKDEKLLSLVAYSCLKKNYLTPALDLAKVLRVTRFGRSNAIYINELFFMKLLIIRYIKDNFDLNSIQIPFIKDNLLSSIFFLIKSQKPNVKNNMLQLIDKDLLYKVYYKVDVNNLIIEEYKNNKLIKKVKYW